MTEETRLKKQIKDYLKLRPVLWWWNFQSVASYKGLPDIFVLKKGKIYGIEVKTKKGKLSEGQEEFLSAFKQRGGIPIVARSLEDVMNCL